MLKLYKRTITRAFTLVESLVAISIISGIASVGYVGFIQIQASSKAVKLEQDIAVVNNALRVYEAHGGSINVNESPHNIIGKLKTIASDDSFKEIIGLRESMIDRRLKIVMQNDLDAKSKQPRALWKANKKKFIIARGGPKGIKAFTISDNVDSTEVKETRNSSLKLAKKSNWVWDYEDSNSINENRFIPVNLVKSNEFSGLESKDYDGPLELNMPSFSMVGGKYPLKNFADAYLSISNPNPKDTSRIFYTSDGNNWVPYEGQSILVNPGETFAAMSASLEPGSWLDSEININTYYADPVKLEIGLSARNNPVNYVQMGGEMVERSSAYGSGSHVIVSLDNAKSIPDRFLNADNFNIVWSSGNDPVGKSENVIDSVSGNAELAKISHNLNTWNGKGDLKINVAAKALNSSIFNDSKVAKISIGIDKLQLEAPVSNLAEDDFAFEGDGVSLFATNKTGELPRGWRIYYTTNGVDPGYDQNGEPLSGELYSTPINLNNSQEDVSTIKARVYGPAGYAHWFNPSSPKLFSLNRWFIPEWNGYVGGIFHKVSKATFHNIRQHQISGSVDLSFDPGYGLNGPGKAIVLQGDGKAVVGGEFTMANGVKSNRIVRFNNDGTIDGSFVTGDGFDNDVLALAIQPDGKIVVGGKFQKYDGEYRMGLARLNEDGSLDSTFNVGRGVHTDQNGWVHGLAIQKEGWGNNGVASEDPYKLIVAGCFTRYNNYPAFSLARVHLNGLLDKTFDTSKGVQGIVHGVCVQNNGKVVIGGNFEKYDGIKRKNIARVNADSGKLDQGFDPGRGTNAPVYTVSTNDDAGIVIGGAFDEVNGSPSLSLARLNKDGSVDNSFQFDQEEDYGDWTAYSSYISDDGSIYVGGEFSSEADDVSRPFIKLTSAGTVSSDYIPQTLPSETAVYAIAERLSGRALITGKFPETHERKTENIARIDPITGSLDPSFDIGNGANDKVNIVTNSSDGNLIVAGRFSEINGYSRASIARVSATGEVMDFSSDVQGGEIMTVTEQPDGKILIGGSFTSVNGDFRFKGLARLNKDGSVDGTFSLPGEVTKKWVQEHPWKSWVGSWQAVSTSGFDGDVRSVKTFSDGTILVTGAFRHFGNIFQPCLALLNSDGSLNDRFSIGKGNIPSSGTVYDCLKLRDGRFYIVGDFPGRIIAYKKDGSLNEAFTPDNIDNTIRSLSVAKDGKIIIAGDFSRVGEKTKKSVAILNKNGGCDENFQPDMSANAQINKVIGLPSGEVVLMGAFSRYGDKYRNGIVRLKSDGSVDESFGNCDLKVTAFLTSQ